MFSSGTRPPSKSKAPRPPDLPKYPLASDAAASRMKKKQAKSIVFNAETHQRLNNLYRKFLHTNKDDSPSRESSSYQPQSPNDVEQPNVQDSPSPQQYRLTKTGNSYYKDPRIYESKVDRERSESNYPSEMSEVQLERMKTKFQRILFEGLGVCEESLLSQLSGINDKAIRLEIKVSRLIGYLTTLTSRLDQMRYRTSQNDILRQLNREYELKIKSLEQEKKALKEQKELEGMRETVSRMRQSNSVRQERGVTPVRDKVAETQKKLLIKENLELKKAKESLDRELMNLREENDKIRENMDQLTAYCKELETGAGVNLDTEKEELYHKVVEHAQELEKRVDVMQFECERKQQEIQELTNSIKVSKDALVRRDQEVLQLKLANKRNTDSSQEIQKLKKSIDAHLEEIQSLNGRLSEAKKEALNSKRIIQKKEIQQKSKIKQIELLKEENQKIRKELTEAIKSKQQQTVQTNKQIFRASSQVNKDQQRKLRRQADDLRQQLLNSKGQLMKLRSTNTELQEKIIELESQTESMRNFILQKEKQIAKNKQMAQQSVSNSIPVQRICKALTSVLQIQAPLLKQFPSQLSSLLQQLYQKLRILGSKLQQSQTQLKKLSLHKNKLDHVLHQDDQQRVEYNDFETTHQDAYFFRQKPKTDANLRQQLKRVAKKLDIELQDNIKNRAEIARLKNRIQELLTNRKLASEALLDVVDEEQDRKLREEQLTVLLSVLELGEEKAWLRQRLLGA